MIWRSLLVVFSLSASISAQSKPSVAQLLDRMREDLVECETALSSVVADERFEQRVVYTRAYQGGLPKTDDELDARGSGVAYYTNFRRFGTGARIIPQLP